jgi:hypothetical protein
MYDFATAPLCISLYMRKILFYFLSVRGGGLNFVKHYYRAIH